MCALLEWKKYTYRDKMSPLVTCAFVSLKNSTYANDEIFPLATCVFTEWNNSTSSDDKSTLLVMCALLEWKNSTHADDEMSPLHWQTETIFFILMSKSIL